MEIITQLHSGESAELKIRGRLDGYWAEHLSTELNKFIREGTHRLWLDLSDVIYLSSLAVGVLMRLRTNLKSLGGSLKVVNPSESVKEVLETVRLMEMLVGEPPGHPAQATWEMRAPRRGVPREKDGVLFETFRYPAPDPLQARVFGDPALLRGCRFAEADCRGVPLGADTFALGVGALGRDYADCQDRFGEFLAAAGVAAYLPTDGSNIPDYLFLGQATSANVRLCYGFACTGQFTHLTRFETRNGAPVTLTDLATTNLDLVGAKAIGLVLIAETAGLMGAALRRSPVGNPTAEAPFGHPAIREWLSFTAERAYRNSTALVVGVATRKEPAALSPLVRPLGPMTQPMGHFHAAPFSHRTLPIGEIDLKGTVAALFETQHLQGVLHLLADYREGAGLGESEFVRGACWAAPLGHIQAERTSL
ncbi:MAG: STAS domain-containing protein [Gemmataceae bacterium]